MWLGGLGKQIPRCARNDKVSGGLRPRSGQAIETALIRGWRERAVFPGFAKTGLAKRRDLGHPAHFEPGGTTPFMRRYSTICP